MSSKKSILASFITITMLSGCASFSNLDSSAFEKGNTLEKQFITDSAQCEMEGEKSRTMGGMGGLAGIASYHETFNRVYDACMRAKGYARKQ
jgi:hypothetical protein